MSKLEYQDELIAVYTGVDLSNMGQSFAQQLNDGITIKINSPMARVIQFKARYAKWLDGPGKDQFFPVAEEYSTDKKLEQLTWETDSNSFPIPYYEEGGAHERTLTSLTIGDQPDVHPTGLDNQALYFESGKDFSELKTYPTKEVFVAASVVIVNNRVERVVYWKRRGKPSAAEYKLIDVQKTNVFDDKWQQVLQKGNYQVPQLQ